MTTIFIESTVIGMDARPLAEWRRGPLMRLAELTAHDARIQEEGGSICSNPALGAAAYAQNTGHRPVVFGARTERWTLRLMQGLGLEVMEATVKEVIETDPAAMTDPWIATVAARGRAHPHSIRPHFTTVHQWALTTAHICEALNLHGMRTSR